MELAELLQEEFNKLDDQIEELFNLKRYKKIIDIELQKWNLLPEPKRDWDESFFITKSLVDEYIREADYQSAEEWLSVLFKSDLERIDDGEREFVAGRLYFESEDYKKSLDYFRIAFKKSEGRVFEDETPKYFDFYRNPDKHIK